jgi:hypothetical protein
VECRNGGKSNGPSSGEASSTDQRINHHGDNCDVNTQQILVVCQSYTLPDKPFTAQKRSGTIVCRVLQSLCEDSAITSVIDSSSKPDELSSEQAGLVRQHLQRYSGASRRKQ